MKQTPNENRAVIRCTECGKAIRSNDRIAQKVGENYYCYKHIKTNIDGYLENGKRV